MTNVAANCFK